MTNLEAALAAPAAAILDLAKSYDLIEADRLQLLTSRPHAGQPA